MPLPFLGVQHDSFKETRIVGYLRTIKNIPFQQQLNKERHHPWTKTNVLEENAFCPDSCLEQLKYSADFFINNCSQRPLAKYLYLPQGIVGNSDPEVSVSHESKQK